MTSDAKIGLLLGLVFIFIIAFIINGLPSLKNEPNGNEMTTEMAEFQKPDVLAQQERAATRQLIDETVSNYNAPNEAVDMGPVALDDSSPANSDIMSNHEMFDSVANIGLDSGSQQLVAADNSGSPASSGLNDLGLPAGDNRVTIDVKPEIEAAVETMTSGQGSEPTPSAIDIPNTIPVKVDVPEPTNTRKHVVAKGETLGAIAKQYYGPDAGNRMANITRIYEANKTLLKSPDAISIGQQLTIPPLPDGTFYHAAETTTPTPTPQLEKPKPQKTVIPPSNEVDANRYYVVKDGDCLSKIAMNELGTVKRLDELTKLNKDLLKDKDIVVVGMKIRLPGP